MLIKLSVLIFFISITLSSAKYNIPSYVNLCKKSDPNLDACWNKNFHILTKKMAESVPDLGLRKLEPIEIAAIKMNLDSSSSSVNFEASLQNVKCFGLSSTILDTNTIDIDNLFYNFTSTVPAIYLESKYKAKGKVLLFQFDSDGTFWGNYSDLHVSGQWYGEKYMKKGKTHVKWTNTTIDIKIQPENIKMYFNNLFKNNDEITENVNKVINENMGSLYDEVKPIVQETVKTILQDSINEVYERVPFDVLYPD